MVSTTGVITPVRDDDLDQRWHVRDEVPALQTRAVPAGRVVFGHLLPWRVPAKITPDDGSEPYWEWYNRGSVRLPAGPRPGLFLRHQRDSNLRVGKVVALLNMAAWLDMAALVDKTPRGDAFLDELVQGDVRVPLSMGFLPIAEINYPDGVERTRVELAEVAIVDKATWPDARVYGVGTLATLAEMQVAK